MNNNCTSTRGKRWGIKKTAFLLSFGLFAGTMVVPAGEAVHAIDLPADYYGSNRLSETEMAMNNSFLYEWSPYRNEVVLAGDNYEHIGHEYYSKDYYCTSSWKLPANEEEEFPIFGGYYENDYFMVSFEGRSNPEESDSEKVIELSGKCKSDDRSIHGYISGINTIEPFVNGKTSITEYNDYLFVRTSHTIYGSQDGKIHQASMMFQYDENNWRISDSFTGEADPGLGFTELSLDQFIQMDGEKLIAVDHGAGNPRALTLYRYNTVWDGTFNKGASNVDMVKILTFPGEAGNEYTATYTGGMEVSSSAYLVAASSGLKNDPDTLTDPDECRNVFIGVVDKDTMTVTKKWLTDYATDDPQISIPRLVKITDDSFYVLWEQNDKVYYQQIDGNGDKIGLLYCMDGVLTDCQPAVIDGAMMWFYRNYKEMTFYRIDLSDPENCSEGQSEPTPDSLVFKGNPNTWMLYPGDQVQLGLVYYHPSVEACPEGDWVLSVTKGDEDAFSLDENGLLTVNKASAECAVFYYLRDGTNEYDRHIFESRKRIQEMSLSETEISLDVGETKELRFTLLPEGETWGAIRNWPGNDAIYSRNEKQQTITGLSPGKDILTYTAVDDRNRKVTCEITVYGTEETPEDLTLKERTYTSVSFNYEQGMEYSCNLENWQDSADFTGLEPGKEYSFYVRKKAHDYYHASEPYGPVKVKPLLQVSDVSVEPDEVTLKEEEESVLSLSVLPLAADNREIQWTSEKPEVAIITTNAENQLVVRGYKYGETTITGNTQDGSDISVSVKATVLEKEHAWDNGTVVKKPTALSRGEKKYTCQNCGEEKIETFYSEEWVDGLWYEKDGSQTYKHRLSWHKNNKGWWVKDTSGWYPKNRWQKIDGKWYFFDKEGYMENNAYRGKSYLQSNGAWDEKALVGWKQTSVGWTYQLSGGAKISGKWAKIDGNWYYFLKNGRMAANEWVNGYWFNANGTWTYKARGSWRKGVGGRWWYGDTSGWFAANGTYTIDGKKYIFDKDGYCTSM